MAGTKEILSERESLGTIAMIFVTVGTHEQPFDRLVKEIDRLVEKSIVTEQVFIQTGYSLYEPQFCEHAKFLKFNEMLDKIENARVVITHAGPSSIMLALYKGKTPVVMPRQKEHGEHVDNHQMSFCRKLEDKGTVLAAYKSEEIKKKIENYEKIVEDLCSSSDKSLGLENRINKFAEDIEEICYQLLKHKKQR